MRYIFLLSLFLILAQASLGQLSGSLSGTLGPGVYTVIGDIGVSAGDSLRLLLGTTFNFVGPYGFGISGTLLAEGTASDSIIFTTDTLANPERYPGLRFTSSGSSGSRLAYCLIENGKAYSGGGVHCRESASPSFTHCTIRRNSADSEGGGIYCFDASPTFSNCMIAENWGGSYGGGVDLFSASPSFRDCIMTAFGGEVLYLWDGAGSHFEHCCIVGHGGEAIRFAGDDPSDGPPGIGRLVTINANGDSCDIYGNIYLGPLFVDPIAGDFHLSDWSPCIGAGQTGGPDEDIEGNPRPNPPGSLPDIGAYENALAAPVPYQGLSGALSGILSPGSYRIAGTISVNAGATLRLLPGTTFLFGGPYYFEVYGTLLSEGTASDSILFTSDGPLPEPWRGLRFVDSGSSSSQLSHCIFEYGDAAGDGSDACGGGAYCDVASPAFSHCIFRYNHATLGGGAYCLSASPSFANCTFEANSAYGGGGVHCSDSFPTFTGCNFLSNTAWGATSYGGAVSCSESSPTFNNCLFGENQSECFGGGVSCRDGSSPTFRNTIFIGNSGVSFGGAAECGESSPHFVNCTLSNNASFRGGGMYCWSSSTPTFLHCTLKNNFGRYEGGALCCMGYSSPSLTRCTLSGNDSDGEGAAVYCENSWPSLNATIIAFSGGEAIYFRRSSAGSQVLYCDFFGNSNGNFVFHNGDSSQGPPNIGQLNTMNANGDSCDSYQNIFLDPEFLSSDDFHLQANSPCIDAGDPNLPLDPDTTVADIGAFYFDQSAAEPIVVLLPKTFALHPNWPNPFNSSTMIRYDVPRTGEVRLTIFNLLGQRVATLVNQRHLAGTYTITWEASNLPSGIYFCRMEAGGFAQTRKLLLVK